MDAAVLRRYLQPSPTLRWHPWAPLVAGLVLLGFAFAMGAWWGVSVGDRMTQTVFSSNISSRGFTEKMRAEMESTRPAMAVYWEARRIDDAVLMPLSQQQRNDSVLANLRDRADWMLVCLAASRTRCSERIGGWHNPFVRPAPPADVRALAEYRVQHLGGHAPRWQRTASYCDESPPTLSGRDFLEEFARIAEGYSKVLGRAVTAQELAPVVPGWRCEPKGKQS